MPQAMPSMGSGVGDPAARTLLRFALSGLPGSESPISRMPTCRIGNGRWRERLLLVAVGDSTLGQIVGGEFQRNAVAIHDLDPVPPESAGHGGQNSFARV